MTGDECNATITQLSSRQFLPDLVIEPEEWAYFQIGILFSHKKKKD